jgi:tyrosyl-tRNA synthetase
VEELLNSLEGVPVVDIDKAKIEMGIDFVSLLSEAGIFASKGEARKMIVGGGVSLNKDKISDANLMIENSFSLHSTYLLVQKGKKNYYLIRFI